MAATKNDVGDRDVAYPGVPVVNWKLGSNNRGFAASAVINDFQQAESGHAINCFRAPAIEQWDVGLGKLQ